MVQPDNFPHPQSDPEAEGLPNYADDETDANGRLTADGPDHAPLPHDTPQAVDRFGVTAAEARQGESLDYKLAQEEPETPATTTRTDRGGPAIEPNLDSPVSVYDRPGLGLDAGEPIGRLVGEPGEPDGAAYDPGAAGGAPTAEEAAMHEVPD